MIAAQSGSVPSKTIDTATGMPVQLPKNVDANLRDWAYPEAFARCFCQWMVKQWEMNSSEHVHAVVDFFHQERTNEESLFLASYWTDEEMEKVGAAMTKLFASQTAR